MPKRMYFTTKLYTFGEVKTEKVILTQPNAQTIGKLEPDQQYLLAPLVSQAPKDPRRKDVAQQAGLQIDFSFDPNKFALSDNENPVEEQHEIFKQFMYERALTIDVWDADSTAHFGQCRIPLSLFLRQGDKERVVGQEFEVIEPENATKVGGLQVMVSNQGVLISQSTQSKAQPTVKVPLPKKAVASNPIEMNDIKEI